MKENNNEWKDEKKGINTEEVTPQVRLFLNEKTRAIFYSQNNIWFLDRREYFIAKMIIKYLGVNGTAKKSSILSFIKNKYAERSNEIINSYNKDIIKIIRSDYKFLVRKNNKVKSYRIMKLSGTFCSTILHFMVPIFIRCQERLTATYSAKIYELNSKGKEVYEKLISEEELNTQKI